MVSYRRLAMRVLGHAPVPFGKKKAAPPPRVAAQRIAALALACAMMTGMALPAFAGTYDIVSGSIDIHATENGNLISQWNWNDENKRNTSATATETSKIVRTTTSPSPAQARGTRSPSTQTKTRRPMSPWIMWRSTPAQQAGPLWK